MSNAAKHKKKAAEFELQKQFDKAIASYVRAIDVGDAEGAEVDVTLLNKVGDLTLRLGRVPEAVASYERAVEHYTAVGLFNNAIALCNKILRHAPGRASVYLTLGRVCARKGMRGDATRNFLEYASRMRQEGRTDEAMRSLAEVAGLMPELEEVRRLVEEHAVHVGIELPTADVTATAKEAKAAASLVFLDIDYDSKSSLTPPLGEAAFEPIVLPPPPPAPEEKPSRTNSLDDLLIFDPTEFGDSADDDWRMDGLESTHTEVVAADLDLPSLLPDQGDSGASDSLVAPSGLTDALGFEPAALDTVEAEVLDGLVTDDEPIDIERGLVPALESAPEPDADSNHGGFAVDLLSLETYDEEMAADDAAMLAELATYAESSEGPAEDEVSVANDGPENAVLEAEDGLQHAPLQDGEEASREVAETPTAIEVTSVDFTWDVTSEIASDLTSDTSPIPWISEEAFDDAPGEPEDYDASSAERTFVAATPETPSEPVVLPFLVFEEESATTAEVQDSIAETVDPLSEAFAEFDLDAIESIGDTLEPVGTIEGLESDSEPLTAFDTPVEPLVAREDTPVTPLEFLEVERETPPGALEYIDVEPMDDVLSEDERPDLAHAAPVLFNAPRARLNPHDFILPGELPPIVYPDALLTPPAPGALVPESAREDGEGAESGVDLTDEPFDELTDELTDEVSDEVSDEVFDELTNEPTYAHGHEDVTEADPGKFAATTAAPFELDDEPAPVTESAVEFDDAEVSSGASIDDDLVDLDAILTPRTPAASINLALDRCTRLREEVERHPGDWARHRRLAEALLEAGQIDAGMDELAATVLGLEVEGALREAAKVTDEMVRVSPDVVSHHQKRVELAVRLADPDRLRESYLDLADALVRTGQEQRAEPVYARVLELDPWDDRARAALGDAAPPPPSPNPRVKQQDDGYVSLTDWLSDGESTRDTRMRVKEPTATGDEDADFDRLLQNFREGVARSLGDEDYESHYDLGVAYKEMGLLDDAVAEFQRALRSPTHRLPAYEALGQCFIEKGSLPVAVTVLSRALHEPGLNDDQRVGVLYLLGYACEALQRRDEARSYFQRVYATDINFRDVADRLAALDRGAR